MIFDQRLWGFGIVKALHADKIGDQKPCTGTDKLIVDLSIKIPDQSVCCYLVWISVRINLSTLALILLVPLFPNLSTLLKLGWIRLWTCRTADLHRAHDLSPHLSVPSGPQPLSLALLQPAPALCFMLKSLPSHFPLIIVFKRLPWFCLFFFFGKYILPVIYYPVSWPNYGTICIITYL